MFRKRRLADAKIKHVASKGFLVAVGFDYLFLNSVIIILAANVEYLLGARYYSKHFAYSFNPQPNPRGTYCYSPHFTDEEIEG